jgi:hypothetical protein
MLDTLEMLEAIGSDASLRYASTVELTTVLEAGRASDALTAAVASGDSSHLAREFGNITNLAPQATQQVFLPSELG